MTRDANIMARFLFDAQRLKRLGEATREPLPLAVNHESSFQNCVFDGRWCRGDHAVLPSARARVSPFRDRCCPFFDAVGQGNLALGRHTEFSTYFWSPVPATFGDVGGHAPCWPTVRRQQSDIREYC